MMFGKDFSFAFGIGETVLMRDLEAGVSLNMRKQLNI